MTDEEFKKSILEAVKPKDKGPNLVDVSFKMLNFIITALVIWIFSVVNETSTAVQTLTIKEDHAAAAIAKFEEFTQVPRFTESDFNANIIPLRNQINGNTTELNVRTELFKEIADDIKDVELRLQKLEFEYKK